MTDRTGTISTMADLVRSTDRETIKHILLILKIRVVQNINLWNSFISWCDDESNLMFMRGLLTSTYPSRMQENPNICFEDARAMLRDAFIYDVFMDLSTMGKEQLLYCTGKNLSPSAMKKLRSSTSTSIMEEVELRFKRMEERKMKAPDLSNTLIQGLDLLLSIQNECAHFRCKAYPIEELCWTHSEVDTYLMKNGLVIMKDWSEESHIHHFSGASVIFLLFSLNKNGKKLKTAKPHRGDPQWRCFALVLCDRMLHERRKETNQQRYLNRFQVRLTGTEVLECCEQADIRYFAHQIEVDAPAKRAWTLDDYRQITDPYSIIPAIPWIEGQCKRKDTPDGTDNEEERKKPGPPKRPKKAPAENKLLPINREYLYRIFPHRDGSNVKIEDRYLCLSPDLTFIPSLSTAKMEVKVIANYIALMAVSHVLNTIGLPLDVVLKVGPECRQEMGLYAIPTEFRQGRTVVIPHIWMPLSQKQQMEQMLEGDINKHIAVGGVVIASIENMLSWDLLEGDLFMSNKHRWDADNSGAHDSVIRAYVDMSRPKGNKLDGMDHKELQSMLTEAGDDRRLDDCLPRFSVGKNAAVLAQKAEANELARMKLTREFLDLVTLVANETERAIVFQQRDKHMGKWIRLYDCGLTYEFVSQLSDSVKQKIKSAMDNGKTIQFPLHAIGLMTQKEARVRDMLYNTLYENHAFISREQRQDVSDLEPQLKMVYAMLKEKCPGHDKYNPGTKSFIRGGIDKAINAYYGPHGDRDTCLNKDPQTKHKFLAGMRDSNAALPTAHEMHVFTLCRSFPSCPKANAKIYHGDDKSGGVRKACTMAVTNWNGGHYQAKRAQVQGKHWSWKEKETTASVSDNRQLILQLSGGLPPQFIKQWFPEYRPGVTEHIDFRFVSTLRDTARGGIDYGLYANGLLNSGKGILSPTESKNYNRGDCTNVFFDRQKVLFTELPGYRPDWHNIITTKGNILRMRLFVGKFLEDGIPDQPTLSQFPFDSCKVPPTKPNPELWPKEKKMPWKQWAEMHRPMVNMNALFGNIFAELLPPDGMVKGICQPTHTMRFNKPCWSMAMNRSITELCVNHDIRLQLVEDKKGNTLASIQTLMFSDGRNRPIPLGAVMDRSGTGAMKISSRSSDLINVESKATLLLTQLYKQISPDRTDCWILFSFLWNHYFLQNKSEFVWNYPDSGYPRILTDKNESDILPMLKTLARELFPDWTVAPVASAVIPADVSGNSNGQTHVPGNSNGQTRNDISEMGTVSDSMFDEAIISQCLFKSWDKISLREVERYVPLVSTLPFREACNAEEIELEKLNGAVSLAVLMRDNFGTIPGGQPEHIVRLAVKQSKKTIESFNRREAREKEFHCMLGSLPVIQRMLFEIYTLMQRYPMHFCGSAGSAVPEGERAIDHGSSQEDAAIRSATGQSLINSKVNLAITSCKEMGNALTMFVNLENWQVPKRSDDFLKPMFQKLKKDNGDLQNQFMCLGHPYIGRPLSDTYDNAIVTVNFSNFPGFVEKSLVNMSYQRAGVIAHESPQSFGYQTEVKISMDWYHPATPYRTVPVNYEGVGPMFDAENLVAKSLLDFNESLYGAIQRKNASAIAGAAYSPVSDTLRHVYGSGGILRLLNDLGGLSETEAAKLEAREEKAEAEKMAAREERVAILTKDVRKVKPYNLEGKLTGITKNVMAAASLRALPQNCTLPLDYFPAGSHIPIPLCTRNSEKVAHSLREKPMPCSLRELDLAPSNCRHNAKTLIAHRQLAKFFVPKVVQLDMMYYPKDTSCFTEEEKHFYSTFREIYPEDGASFDDVFEVLRLVKKEAALQVCETLADMIFMNVVQRIGGNVPFGYGYPDFKRSVYTGNDQNVLVDLTLPTRFEAGVYAQYCKSWVAQPGVTPSSIISDQHYQQVPSPFRDGSMAMAHLRTFLVSFAEANLEQEEDANGMMAIQRYLLGTFNTSGGFFNIDRSTLVNHIAAGLRYYCVDVSKSSALFLASQVVADLESTVPGICGEVKGDSVHPAWGGLFGIGRLGKKYGSNFTCQLNGVFLETEEQRQLEANERPIELALQGYAREAGTNKIINLRTFAPYSPKDTEHEGCKGGTVCAQAHTTRTVSEQRTQTKVCAHPLPGTKKQRSFLGNTVLVLGVIGAALGALDVSRVIGDFPQQMHYYKPCWYYSHEDGEDPAPFLEEWYTWGEVPQPDAKVSVKRKREAKTSRDEGDGSK